MVGRPYKYDYSYLHVAVDWLQTNRDIAKSLNMDKQEVSRIKRSMKRLGYIIPRGKNENGIPREKWEKAGIGELSDSEVARKLGISRERVRQVRNKFGIPLNLEAKRLSDFKSRKYIRERYAKQRRKFTKVALQYAKKGYTTENIAKMIERSVLYVQKLLSAAGFKRYRPIYMLATKYDWSKDNHYLAKVTGLKYNTISIYRRKLRDMGYTNTYKGRMGYKGKLIKYGKESLSIQEWAKKIGIKVNTLRQRLEIWSVKEALTEPLIYRGKRNGKEKEVAVRH